MKRTLSFVLLCLLSVGMLFAADRKNAAADSDSWREGPTFVVYEDTLMFADGEKTDNVYSQALWIADANLEYGQISAWCSDGTGTEDVDIYVEYSADPSAADSSFSGSATAYLDQVQTTAKWDTLGIDPATLKQDRMRGALWVRIKADGQTGNPANTILHYSLFFHKKTNAPLSTMRAKSAD